MRFAFSLGKVAVVAAKAGVGRIVQFAANVAIDAVNLGMGPDKSKTRAAMIETRKVWPNDRSCSCLPRWCAKIRQGQILPGALGALS